MPDDVPPRPSHVLFVTEQEWLAIMDRIGGRLRAEGTLVEGLLDAIEAELAVKIPKCVFGVQLVEVVPEPRLQLID
jgi:hypothetical protein